MSEPAPEPQPDTEQPEPVAPEPDTEREPESDGDEENGEPEQPEQPASQGPSPEEMEKRFQAAGRAFKSYTTRIGTIFEEQANELVECPLCSAAIPGFVHTADAGRFPDETRAAVQTFLGVVQETDYKASTRHHICDDCDGLGQVATGSRLANFKLTPCATCRGTGYLPPPGQAANGRVDEAPVLAPVGAGSVTGEAPDVDPNGSPRLLPDGTQNPNYGKWPQYKDPRLP